jgi:hypothetical protein
MPGDALATPAGRGQFTVARFLRGRDRVGCSSAAGTPPTAAREASVNVYGVHMDGFRQRTQFGMNGAVSLAAVEVIKEEGPL